MPNQSYEVKILCSRKARNAMQSVNVNESSLSIRTYSNSVFYKLFKFSTLKSALYAALNNKTQFIGRTHETKARLFKRVDVKILLERLRNALKFAFYFYKEHPHSERYYISISYKLMKFESICFRFL